MRTQIFIGLLIGSLFLASRSEGREVQAVSERPRSTTNDNRYPELVPEFNQLESGIPRKSYYPDEYYYAKLAAAFTFGAVEENRSSEYMSENYTLYYSDLPSGYIDILDDIFNEYTEDSGDIEEYPEYGEKFDIYFCEAVITDFDPSGKNRVFDELAAFFIRTEANLMLAGYGAQVADAPLAHFERRALELIDEAIASGWEPPDHEHFSSRDVIGPAIEALAFQAESRRKLLQPDLPEIVAEGACGGGEAAVQIRTEPANGRVWMITAHSFYRCALRSRNPWNLGSCRWLEISPDVPIFASGRKYYQVHWPGAAVKRGDITFHYDDGFREGQTFNVTLRP